MPQTHIIIGASAAGLSAAHAIHTLDPVASIIIVCQEPKSYNKCVLTSVLAHSVTPEKALLPCNTSAKIHWMWSTRVVKIDRAEQSILTACGQRLFFDRLCIATGSLPAVPPIMGRERAGVFTFHTLQDLYAIEQFCERTHVQRVLIIGAGLTGLECADALSMRGYTVTVVEKNSHILPMLLDAAASSSITASMRTKNIQFFLNSTVTEIEGTSAVRRARLADGTFIEAQLIIFATGTTPNSYLFTGDNAGIEVDATMATNHPRIYAAGDVTRVADLITGEYVPTTLWPEALAQGRVAGAAMAGDTEKRYPGIARVAHGTLAGISLASCGPVTRWQGESIIRQGPGFYQRFLVEGDRLRGFCLVGQVKYTAVLKMAILEGASLEKLRLSGLAGGF